MDGPLSGSQLASFFAWAPLVLGVIIFLVAYYAKRHEGAETVSMGQTFACSGCGRRGVRAHMVPQAHAGAVSWYCSRCAGH